MSKEDIRVLKIICLPGDRTLKAYVDVQVGSWTINDWRILQKPDERVQILGPQVSYRDSKGTIRYRNLLLIPNELRQRIEVAILSSWEKESKGERNNGSNE